jgi:hypothetical protein
LGRTIPERIFKYRLSLKGGWSTEFESPLEIRKLPKRIASVEIPQDAKIELVLT